MEDQDGPKESLHLYTPKISFHVYTIMNKYWYNTYNSRLYDVNVSWIAGDASRYGVHLMQLLPKKSSFWFQPYFTIFGTF